MTTAVPRPLDDLRADCGANPDEVSDDEGYCTEAKLADLARRRITGKVRPAACALRGLDDVRDQWAMICTAHNLRNLARPRA